MPHVRFPRVLPLAAVLLAAGCGSTEPEVPDLDGTWLGAITTDLGTETWTHSITDNNGQISGSLSVAHPAGIVSGSLSGSYDHPRAEIRSNLTLQGWPVTCIYQATVSDSRQSMSGTCNCNDGTVVFVSASLTLQKQS